MDAWTMTAHEGDASQPSVDELLESVVEWLRSDLVTADDPVVAYRARVAANLIDLVRRDISLTPQLSARRESAVTSIGSAHEADLARQLRDQLRPVDDDVLAVLDDITQGRLAIDAPHHLRRGGSTDAAS